MNYDDYQDFKASGATGRSRYDDIPFKNGRAEVRNTEVSGKYYINDKLERIVE